MSMQHSKYYIRFALEIIALVYIAFWATKIGQGWVSVFAGISAAFSTMLLWGVFNVPGDPSRSGKAPITVPGWLRLLIELLVFGAGTLAIYFLSGWIFALLFLVTLVAHYFHIKDRVIWLIKQ